MAAAADVVEAVVIFFFENHTFDNLASDVAGGDGGTGLPLAPDVMVHDPPHGHPPWMMRDQPAPKGAVRLRYSRPQVPILYSLMDAFTVCDRYFADVAANSFPNHAFAIGADAQGAYANPDPRKQYNPQITTPGLPARLEAANKTWANYGPGFAFPQYTDALMHKNRYTSQQFLTDAAAGSLPEVSWVYAPGHQSFHPGPTTSPDGSSMATSDAWLGTAMRALLGGHRPDGQAIWDHLVVFITFDDWGGWSDHVVPPVVERFPADHPLYPNEPYRYGSRVPCVVVSPYAKTRHVSHDTASHTSLVAFIERLWTLPPSPAPDAAARTTALTEHALADCFDYNQTPTIAPTIPQPAAVAAPPQKAAAKKAAKKRAAVTKQARAKKTTTRRTARPKAAPKAKNQTGKKKARPKPKKQTPKKQTPKKKIATKKKTSTKKKTAKKLPRRG